MHKWRDRPLARMHIFIDESGLFLPSASGIGVSVVGALVIPDCRRAHIERKFAAIRPGLPKERGEVKGRLLTEAQVTRVVDLLRRNEVLLELVAIDLNIHTPQDIELHKLQHAAAITRSLTDAHPPEVRREAADRRARVEALSPQLYAQGAAMFSLVEHTIEVAINYFAQRQPRELAEFRWTVDGKGTTGPTNWEVLWHSLVCPVLQTWSIDKPMGMFEFADFSHFARFIGPAPTWLPAATQATDGATNINLLLTEHFRNSSAVEPGLELADIVVSAARRAIVGSLKRDGWNTLPSLMIHRPQHYINLVALHGRERTGKLGYERVIDAFRRGGRNMIAPKFYKDDVNAPRARPTSKRR